MKLRRIPYISHDYLSWSRRTIYVMWSYADFEVELFNPIDFFEEYALIPSAIKLYLLDEFGVYKVDDTTKRLILNYDSSKNT